jgi:molecular chaperone GrpE
LKDPDEKDEIGRDRTGDDVSDPAIKVQDRRHWAREDSDDEEAEDPSSTRPTIIEAYEERARVAEERLQDYIAAFKQAQAEHDAFRERLGRDVDRRVALQFAELISDLLLSVDDLELALSHVEDVPEAKPLADGVALARDRFLAALEKRGVEKLDPAGEEFDPNTSEALRVDTVDDPDLDGKVTETLRPGYRLGDHVVRPARVAVGRRTG